MRRARSATRVIAALVAAALTVVPAVDAKHRKKPPQKKGATYTAFTSQGTAACRANNENGKPCDVFVGVRENGKKVNAELIRFSATCADGKIFRSSTLFRKIKIKKGRYSKASSYAETLGDGSTAESSVSTHGKFKHKHGRYSLKGDFSIESDLTFTDGSTTHCESGDVTFVATTQ